MKSKEPASWIRGATRREDVRLEDFSGLAAKWARRYLGYFLGDFQEAHAIAMLGLVEALERWDPSRGPFEKIAPWYVQSALTSEMDKIMRRSGVPNAERRGAYFNERRTGEKWTSRPGHDRALDVVSSSFANEKGEDRDLFDSVLPDESLVPADEMIDRERLAARVREVVDAAPEQVRDSLRRLLQDDADPREIRVALNNIAGPRSRGLRAVRRNDRAVARLRGQLADLPREA